MSKHFILIIIIFSIIVSCSESKQDAAFNIEKNYELAKERKSIHQEEYEKYSNDLETRSFSDNYKFSVESVNSITESSLGRFRNPKYSISGEFIIFTTNDFNQIWLYNTKSDILEKIIEMSQCGNNFQISDSGDNVYFRNRAKNGKSGGTYSFFSYSIKDKKMDVVYSSKNRISPPLYVSDNIYFIENNVGKIINIFSKETNQEFETPFFYVMDNNLLRLHNRVDTITYNDIKFKFINCSLSRDGKYISALTANKGTLIFDTKGDFVSQFANAFSLDILYNSNLVVFTEEIDDGQKILNSKVKIGFLNSDKVIDFSNEINEKIFNPEWSPEGNKIVFNTNDGLIKIITFKIENK